MFPPGRRKTGNVETEQIGLKDVNMDVEKVTFAKARNLLHMNEIHIPIEQSAYWARFQNTIDGREEWAVLCVRDDAGTPLATANFIRWKTHGFSFLRSQHGPVFITDMDERKKADIVEEICRFVKKQDHNAVFLRLNVSPDLLPGKTFYPLSGVPYDATVVVDVREGSDAILSRMKQRGRRDVRKALREAPVVCADETEQGTSSFEPYYSLMEETGDRDGFSPAPLRDYENMIRILGADHCRLYAARDKESGKLVSWSIYTINDRIGVRYYAASSSDYRSVSRNFTDALVYYEFCELGKLGCDYVDMMGIGSDFSPSLMGLNEFKTKFTKEIITLPPDEDVVLHPYIYNLLKTIKKHRG